LRVALMTSTICRNLLLGCQSQIHIRYKISIEGILKNKPEGPLRYWAGQI